MTAVKWNRQIRQFWLNGSVLTLAVASLAGSTAVQAQQRHDDDSHFRLYPNNLVVSRSVYDNKASNVTVGEILPPNCANTQGGCSASTGATNNGLYPYVFNNDSYDGSFGITSRLYLDQITPEGWSISTLELPNSLQHGVTSSSDQLVTSFSSKSEGALNLSTSGKYLTFIDYVAPVNTIDASNSNTPLAVDPTNPVGEAYYRAVATLDAKGHLHFTETNAYSGNNGRAAILNDKDGLDLVYTAGNAGNGSNPQPEGVVLGAGAQLIPALKAPEDAQDPGLPTPVASFNVTQLSDKKDKIGKDDNFRGMTIFNNVLYYTKGSGSNGVNTVYFVDTTGTACPKGTGVPVAGAALPTSSIVYDPSTVTTDGLSSNMCILNGFPTLLAKSTTGLNYPFGIWFADANTLYVADEGDGYNGGTDLYTHASGSTGGLQKWVFNASTGSWSLAYTLTNGLNIGTPYTVKGYPTGTNSGAGGSGLPWAPATDGLRNITGRVNWDGTVTIWAITSTVSGSGDQGADPNKLVAITDKLSNTTSAQTAKEKFVTVRSAGWGEVLRGVSFTPTEEAHEGHGW
ncbi:hypothetical protein ACFPT7_17400 [Acidicapsa dinghuensis]|uniref:DUF839 domain-containing protein n=1 Tax=Acidicapsa dinghuensis TaxID=2218256 RepID=A0ABW1EII8_9BACT|nr:hypothetical protein [Acidicapsa dinghuensis]